ncbi:fatty acid desaturase family protein [Agitococcus lubricus]|uniref:Linoleoyl-CoA desaturase n=1 Tax=Agitococcus lubricus TaxID=1077255 RepID=A0A2T5IYY5_9GAMM|nr:acyl-CoA desaturase [Agitococcus lubricus]PTQ89222.1 linoleoyl-CoA desaturase [Agitococcus lubricus]
MSEAAISTSRSTHYTQTQKQAFYDQIEQEFDAIKNKYRAQLGQKDIDYIVGLRRKSRVFEVAGRGLLWLSSGPISFGSGVFFLWLHRNLEAIEIGHNVLHGQYDYFPEIPEFHAHNFKWKAPIDEEGWRREHNAMHHVHTNVFEKDPDLNHGVLRTNDLTPWHKSNLYQVPLYLGIVYPTMLYHFNAQNLGFTQDYRQQNFADGNKGYAVVDQHPWDAQERLKRRQRSVWRVWAKEFAAFPVMAQVTGFSGLKVFAGNLLADTINNYWIALTIQATHLTEPLQPEEAVKHKGHWYLTQLDSSVNFKGNRVMSILWGHLNYQIEHHLFPDIPSHRYPDMAKEVKAVCAKYDIPYKCNPSWSRAIKNYVSVLWKYSFPSRKGAAQDA